MADFLEVTGKALNRLLTLMFIEYHKATLVISPRMALHEHSIKSRAKVLKSQRDWVLGACRKINCHAKDTNKRVAT